MINVNAGSSLQAAINSAPAGETLNLEPAATFAENIQINKPLTLQGKALIRTTNADPAIFVAPKTRDVKFIDLSVTNTSLVYDIVRVGTWQTSVLEDVPTNISFERVDIFGQDGTEVQRGIAGNGANISVLNSKIRGIHGRGYDTQAFAAWNGPGPFKILDSYLEAAGENVMFGGADPRIPDLVPSNIEIRRNHIFKPLSWKMSDPSYAGIHWTVKNLLELKMARNVVIDGNVLENCWGDAQIGYAVLFTVRNQDGTTPWAIVENVQFTNNTIKNSEQGIQTLGKDSPNVSQQSNGLRIANNLFTDIKHWGIVVASYADMTIEHNTHFQGHNVLVLTGTPTTGFTYRNNLTFRNDYGVKADGLEEGNASLQVFTPQVVFQGNILVNAIERFYPTANYYPATMAEVQMGADYRLASTSPYKGKGTDGKDPGVDMDQLLAAQSGTITPTPIPPTPTPTPPTLRKVPWPSGEAKQNAILNAQWLERYRFKRHLTGAYAEFESVN